MKVLVTGADGQLGKSLAYHSEDSEGLFLFVSRSEMDICDPVSIRSTLELLQPDYIVNCAAYTAVDKAESEENLARAVNRDGVINLINESNAFNCKIIQISSDYVFNGTSSRPYEETDSIDPQSVYGKTKAEGEEALWKSAGERSIIIRTSWLYSEFGHNFLKTMLKLGKERESLNVVNDQLGVPTYCGDLANAVLTIIEKDPEITPDNHLLHFSNSGETNWFEFASEIMKLGKLDCRINPIPTSDYPTAAKRPQYSVLSTKRIEKELGIKSRNWKLALQECMETITKENL